MKPVKVVIITLILILLGTLFVLNSKIKTFKETKQIQTPTLICLEKEGEKETMEYLGKFKLTGYCPCEKCCGEYADGITATGTIAEEGRTIAVDPNVIPLGSKVLIDGHIYIAEDTGSAINENRIDIFKSHHEDCFGSDCNGYHDVYLILES